MTVLKFPPVIRPEVEALFAAEDASRHARRLISPKPDDENHAVVAACAAVDRIAVAIASLGAARAVIRQSIPAHLRAAPDAAPTEGA